MIVMTSDLFTELNFVHLLDFHRAHVATMCVHEHKMQVICGVIETDDRTG